MISGAQLGAKYQERREIAIFEGCLRMCSNRGADLVQTAIWPIYIGNLALDGTRRYRDAPGRSPMPSPTRPRSKLAHCPLWLHTRISRRSICV